MTATIKPASLKSVQFLARLRKVNPTPEQIDAMVAKGQAYVSQQIDLLKAQVVVSAPAVAKGEWHVYGNEFYLVAMSQGSGHLYAKKRLQGGGFVLGAGIIKKLSADTKVGPQHTAMIAEFGHLHDRCVFCYLPLDLPESRTAGYGEKCASNYGLPWG